MHIASRIITLSPGRIVLEPAWDRDRTDLFEFIEHHGVLATTVLPYTKADALRDWYWGLVDRVAKAHGILKQDLHNQLKVSTNFISNWALTSVGPVPILASIRRGITMARLREYEQAAVDCVVVEWMQGITHAEARRQIDEWLGPRPD